MQFRVRLQSLAAGIVGSDDAEDVLHDAFCRLWSKHPDVADESEAIRLSYTAVRNSAIDVFRSGKSHPVIVTDEFPEDTPVDDDVSESDKAATFEAVVELSRKILGETQYKVFSLHDIQGVGYPEIAEMTGMSQVNVRMTLSRARKTIREYYRKTAND